MENSGHLLSPWAVISIELFTLPGKSRSYSLFPLVDQFAFTMFIPKNTPLCLFFLDNIKGFSTTLILLQK